MNMSNADFTAEMTRKFVWYPDEVQAHEKINGDRRTVYLTVASPDKGKTIGAGGQNFFAWSTLVGARGKIHGQEVSLNLVDTPEDERLNTRPFDPDEDWMRDPELVEVAQWLFSEVFPKAKCSFKITDSHREHTSNLEVLMHDLRPHNLVAAAAQRYLRSVAVNMGRKLNVTINVDRAVTC